MADSVPLVARIMVQHGGGATASGGGGGSSRTMDRKIAGQAMDTKKIANAQQAQKRIGLKSLAKAAAPAAAVLAIGAVVFKMFKNSQVAKAGLGAIFAILGFMVDSFLAPFLPMIGKMISKMATWIPVVAAWGEKAAVWVGKAVVWLGQLWDLIKNLRFIAALKMLWLDVIIPIIKGIWRGIGNGIKHIWQKLKENFTWLQSIENALVWGFNLVWDIIKGVWDIAKGIWNGILNLGKTLWGIIKSMLSKLPIVGKYFKGEDPATATPIASAGVSSPFYTAPPTRPIKIEVVTNNYNNAVLTRQERVEQMINDGDDSGWTYYNDIDNDILPEDLMIK